MFSSEIFNDLLLCRLFDILSYQEVSYSAVSVLLMVSDPSMGKGWAEWRILKVFGIICGFGNQVSNW